MRVTLALLLAGVLAAGCRTARLPDEAPVPPLSSSSPENALAMLRERMTKLEDIHALLRLRVSTPERTDSFKAALTVTNHQHMELVVYTPLNTTAATITSDGPKVTIHDVLHGSTTTVTSQELARQYGIFLPDVLPSDMALLFLGFPSVANATYEAEPTGLRRATVSDTTIDYDPAVQPVQTVRMRRPALAVEMSVLEAVAR